MFSQTVNADCALGVNQKWRASKRNAAPRRTEADSYRTSRITDEQIIAMNREHESDMKAADIYQKHGLSETRSFIDTSRIDYNTVRLHTSLRGLGPAVFSDYTKRARPASPELRTSDLPRVFRTIGCLSTLALGSQSRKMRESAPAWPVTGAGPKTSGTIG
jgi:hypothetical protein